MLTRAEEKLLFRLRQRKQREATGLFLAEGERVVRELAGSGLGVRFAVVADGFGATEPGAALVARLEARCPVRRVPERRLAELAATESPQGILAVAEARETSLAELRLAGAARVLLLDAVQDPGNVGTLIRSAAAFGAVAVARLPGTADPWNPKAVRASAGATFRIPMVRAEEDALAPWLEREGATLYAADASGEPAGAVDFAERAVLAVGNEGAGLSERVASLAARVVAVPIVGPVESLNVSVAGGILLYLMTRRR